MVINMSFNFYTNDKINNSNMLLIYKVGIFYEVYNEDAYILHYLTKYNIKKFKRYHRVGFPLSRLNSIIKLLDYNNIGYIVNDNLLNINNKIIDNKYFDILGKSISFIDSEGLINMIIDKLSLMNRIDLEKLYIKNWYQ